MATHDDAIEPRVDLDWNPPKHAISCTRWEQDLSPTILLLTHPAAPYFAIEEDALEKNMLNVAYKYLSLATKLDLTPPFELELGWLDALNPGMRRVDLHFGWMRMEEDPKKMHNIPLGSVDVSNQFDHFAVLFAAERYGRGKFIGSEFGLRVAMHWRRHGRKKLFYIVGASATLPFGIYKTSRHRIDARDVEGMRKFLFEDEGRRSVAQASGFDEETIRIRGARVATLADKIVQVERQAIGLWSQTEKLQLPYVISTVSSGPLSAMADQDRVIQSTAMVADATNKGKFRLFNTTPHPVCVCRPRRDGQALDISRVTADLKSNKTKTPLKDGTRLQVLPSTRFVRSDKGLSPPLVADTPGDATSPEPRSNVASALQGFWHSRDLLQRMTLYGLDSKTYFRFINPMLEIAYRSGVSPGPGKDGQSVNARVLPTSWPADFIGPVDPADLPTAQIHLSLADRARRERAHWKQTKNPQPAIPLGIGSDPRWMWHEFGHVLTLASTGELELRFAHSPGDALAAIVGDPELEVPYCSLPWRGATFPWVYLPRRHDRCPSNGWSWSGTMHQDLDRVPASLHPRRKGYQSEQILSSSLFRLYRCIGGDTVDANGNPNTEKRREASHYASYLIMRTLQVLGDSKVTPAMKPEQFVQAMIEADEATGNWQISYALPGQGPKSYSRVGGCTTKVIRWAFEAQGLYGNGNNRGSPDLVDIYVKSNRKLTDETMQGIIKYDEGSYVPASLHWQADASQAAVPDWQADKDHGIKWDDQQNKIVVTVGNRGSQPASNVRVSAWAAAWQNGPPPPDWKTSGGAWSQLQPNSPNKPIGASQSETFEFDFNPGAGGHVVVAIAHCPEDPANVFDASHTCSSLPTPLVDVVAGDNNMGLLAIHTY